MINNQMYTTLADVYAAILRGKLKREDLFAVADGGQFSIWHRREKDEFFEAEKIYRGSSGDALKFVVNLLGIDWMEP